MNNNGIDDLLPKVSKELVDAYQSRNLDGKTLSAVNEEYKASAQQNGMSPMDLLWLVVSSSFIGAMLFGYLYFWTDVPGTTAFLADIAISAPAFLYVIFPVRWKFENDRATQYRCEPILRDFRKAVEALNPLASIEIEDTVGYTDILVHNTLIHLTAALLRAEGIFRRMCEIGGSTDNIVAYGIAEQKCRKQRDDTLSACEKFGIIYARADMDKLSRDAKRHIERTAEV